MINKKISDDPLVTVQWHGGDSHIAHIIYNGKEVNAYTFGEMGGGRRLEPVDFHRWLKGAKADIIESIEKGWY